MRIWLIKQGEPLPSDGPQARLLRTGLLARQLVQAGHDVTWWSSTFNHQERKFRAEAETVIPLEDRLRMHLLHSCGYQRNVSLARVKDHKQLAAGFAAWTRRETPPDLILCCLPLPGLCLEATRYGREKSVPVVIDIRDLWPDVHLDLLPGAMRWAGRILLHGMTRTVRTACHDATALTAITPYYLAWGLRHAGREATDLDGVFTMGYTDKTPSPAEVEQGNAFWAQRGLTPGDETFTVCYFGVIGYQCDVSTVLRAARLLKDEKPGFRFIFCGKGDKVPEYRQMAGDLPRVDFPGWVEFPQIYTLMRLAKAGIAPYYSTQNYEWNFPNKPIEYMAGGLPVLSGVRGLLQETLASHDCGLTYREGDAEHLASLLRQLRDDPARREAMARNARALYEKQFVAEQVYARMAEHLVRVAERAGNGPSRGPGRAEP